LILAFYAYFLNILGPITPFLKDELSLSYTVSSLHFTAFALGIIIVGLVGHYFIRWAGRRWALWSGAAGLSLGVLLLVAGRSPLVTIGASFLMGLVGSLILAVVPSALSDQHGGMQAVAISEANVVSSLVSAAAPLLVGWFALTAGGWRLALVVGALAPLGLYFGLGRVAIPRTAVESEQAQKAGQPLPGSYWILWVALLLAVSVEFCMVFWSASYMENSLGLAKAGAAQTTSLFLAGMISGRLAASRLVQRMAPLKVVLGSLAIAAAGFLVYWSAGTPWLGAVGLFFTGLGVASLYPLILSMAINAAGGNSVQAGARASLASGTAIFALPLVLGRLADAVGIRLAYGMVAFLLVGVFLILLLNIVGAKHPKGMTIFSK
jgi:fucose permease